MTKARRAPRAQMQRRALAYRLAPWALPVSKRTRELITTGKPAIQAAYQALNELGPAPFVPEVSERESVNQAHREHLEGRKNQRIGI